ncbi:hypothetical protein LIA77_00956 [Sarocladium implicatum]|nr:hypothetical protein LIA77_00956 [Sarocladium implicatum]
MSRFYLLLALVSQSPPLSPDASYDNNPTVVPTTTSTPGYSHLPLLALTQRTTGLISPSELHRSALIRVRIPVQPSPVSQAKDADYRSNRIRKVVRWSKDSSPGEGGGLFQLDATKTYSVLLRILSLFQPGGETVKSCNSQCNGLFLHEQTRSRHDPDNLEKVSSWRY